MWVAGITEIILKYTKPLLKKSGIQILHSNYEWDKYYEEITARSITPSRMELLKKSASQTRKLRVDVGEESKSPYKD